MEVEVDSESHQGLYSLVQQHCCAPANLLGELHGRRGKQPPQPLGGRGEAQPPPDAVPQQVPYTVLAAGETKLYRTWESHIWTARTLTSEGLQAVNGAWAVAAWPGETTVPLAVSITAPPALMDQDLTAGFHHQQAAFKAAVRALLLCHARLHTASGRSSAPSTSHGSSSGSGGGSMDRGGSQHTLGSIPSDLVGAIVCFATVLAAIAETAVELHYRS